MTFTWRPISIESIKKSLDMIGLPRHPERPSEDKFVELTEGTIFQLYGMFSWN